MLALFRPAPVHQCSLSLDRHQCTSATEINPVESPKAVLKSNSSIVCVQLLRPQARQVYGALELHVQLLLPIASSVCQAGTWIWSTPPRS